MSRLKMNNLNDAPEKSQPLLQAVNAKLGKVLNIHAAMANSPAALNGYLSFNNAMGETVLTAQMREAVALAVAEENSCEYCLSAHTIIGGKAGLSKAEIALAREGTSSDAKTAALLRFVKSILSNKGKVPDADFQLAKAGGLSDAELTEAVGLVALNVFTNYFNNMSQHEVDFPKVEPMPKAA